MFSSRPRSMTVHALWFLSLQRCFIFFIRISRLVSAVVTFGSLHMFGQQQQQQGTMPQFPHMFGGTNLRQPAQFTVGYCWKTFRLATSSRQASPFNVAPAVPLQQQQHAADAAGRPVQPPQGQAQVPGQGLPPMGAGRFAMAFGQGAPQVVGNPNGRASSGAHPTLALVLLSHRPCGWSRPWESVPGPTRRSSRPVSGHIESPSTA